LIGGVLWVIGWIGGWIAARILGGFIPGFGIAYFPFQIFGGDMRLIDSLAGRVGQYFSITHDK
jgi:hypothetical protein